MRNLGRVIYPAVLFANLLVPTIGMADDSPASLKQACDGGEVRGCALLAEKYFWGKGVPKDNAQAAALRARGCDLTKEIGYLHMCADAGDFYESKDAPRAVELYKKACDGGEQRGCTGLGDMYESGSHVAKNHARATELYKKAIAILEKLCETAHPLNCHNLAIKYANGDHVAKDLKRAAALYKKSCDAGWKFSCEALQGLKSP